MMILIRCFLKVRKFEEKNCLRSFPTPLPAESADFFLSQLMLFGDGEQCGNPGDGSVLPKHVH